MDGKITSLTAIGAVDMAADYLEIVDISANASKKVTPNNLIGIGGGAVLSTTDTQTVQNKTLDNTNTVTLKDNKFTLQDNGDATKQAVFELSGITTATTRTYTLPNASTTLVGTTATQTLTNKTLTNPTLTLPTITDFTNAQHDHSSASQGGSISGGGGGGGSGVVAKLVDTISGEVGTSEIAIPYDNTLPVATEGEGAISLTYTGLSGTNMLAIDANIMVSSHASSDVVIGFIYVYNPDDDTSTTLGVGTITFAAADKIGQLQIHASVFASTNELQYIVNVGSSNAGTVTINGVNGSGKFSTQAHKSSMTITEYTPAA